MENIPKLNADYVDRLGAMFHDAERSFRAGEPETLKAFKKFVDDQIEGSGFWLEQSPAVASDLEDTIRIWRWYSQKAQKVLDAGPQDEPADVPTEIQL